MKKYLLYILLFCLVTISVMAILIKKYPSERKKISKKILSLVEKKIEGKAVDDDLADQVLPPNGITIPVKLGDLGEKMIQAGVIDKDKIDALYTKRGSREEMDRLLTKTSSNITITKGNANFLLNFFWALGLGNKNSTLTQGPMVQNGDLGNFASTGGWTLSNGQAMDHYSKHEFIILDPNQQKMVIEITKNIYRPCCGNSTYFPDCNHGMAMLGFIELMASQGFSDKEIYKAALALNSFWFPNDYLTIAEYFNENGQDWQKVDPKIVLGKNYSSGQGIATVKSKVKNPPFVIGGGACGV